ncbi:transcriptional regulation of mitochondrial recombination-domain-containing protein [Usnea florida]
MANPSAVKVLVRPITRLPKAPLPQHTLLIHKPIQKGVRLPTSKTPLQAIHHGQHIYFYNNIRTNQVVYSLTRHLDNAASLAQLPFLGKKTVPAKLRKDLWNPFCMVYFPSPHLGLAAYTMLREFRVLHEKNYPLDIITETEGKRKGSLMSKKRRGRVLMDQKANSVADLAAVLQLQEKGPSEERILRAERRRRRVETLKRQKGEGKVKKRPIDVASEMGGIQGVKVRWADILDAEYAETWPEAVIHGRLERHRYTAAFPAVEIAKDEEGVRNEFVLDGGDGGVEQVGEGVASHLVSSRRETAQKQATATA